MAIGSKRRHIAMGTALIAALVVGAVVIFMLDDVTEVLADQFRVVAVFEGARGLRAGSAVWLAGREVGTVVAVDFLPPTGDTIANVAAVLVLPERVRPLIRRDSEVGLMAKRFIGDPVVTIQPGTRAAPPLHAGDTLRAEPPPITLDTLLARAMQVAQTLDLLRSKARTLSSRAGARAESLDRVRERVAAVRSRLGEFAAALEAAPLAELLEDGEGRARLDTLLATLGELRRAFRAQPWTGGDGELGPALASLASRAERLDRQLGRLQALLQEPRGTGPRIARDSALVLALDRVRAELDSLIAEIQEDPAQFVY